MKKTLSILFSIIGAVSVASASSNFAYTATGDPGAAPDGVDQNSNSVDVWTVVLTPGANSNDGSGTGFYNPDGANDAGGNVNAWQAYSYQNSGVGNGGSVDASTTFPGGALSVGQTVSIDFVMRALDNPSGGTDLSTNGQAGISLLNSSGNAITFAIIGGGPNHYYYTDAGSTGASAGAGLAYQYQNQIHIAITVTGVGTYSATAFNGSGVDNWSGTFSGSLIGMNVFNHKGGNGSDVGFNNLKVNPQLVINNIFPNDSVKLFNVTNNFTFNVASAAGNPVNASGIQLILNGVDVSSNLVLTGAGTINVGVSYTNLLINHPYTGQINVTNQSGVSTTAPVLFDTFYSTNFIWEAEDYDFNSGQFINSPILSSTAVTGSYFGVTGTEGIDFHDYSGDGPKLFRPDPMSTDVASDTPRQNFVSAGVSDYQVGFFDGAGFATGGNVGLDGYQQQEWVNYTRNFPAGTYNLYARISNGNGGTATVPVSQVVGGQGTSSQTNTAIGAFNFPATGWSPYNLIPMTDRFGNAVAISLSGTNTLRVSAGSGANLNFFMLTPVDVNTPTITGVYPDGSTLVQGTNKFVFTVSSPSHSIAQNNVVLTLNGVTNHSLTFTGSASSWNVSAPLALNVTNYTAVITVTDNLGNSHATTIFFDTFNPASYDIEAEDFDFDPSQSPVPNGSGLGYIDNPVITSEAAANSYFDQVGVQGTDEYWGDVATPTTADFHYREADGIATSVCTDTPTRDLLAAQLTNSLAFNYNVAWWSTNGWLNYTHNYPAGNYNVYGRLASNPGSTTQVELDSVGTSNTNLGTFTEVGRGYNFFDWVPLVNTNNGQLVTVTLGGVATLRTTSITGNVNPNSYLLVPVVATATLLQSSYSAGVLTLSWSNPALHLQAQTNALSVGLKSNWFDYPGGGTSPVNIPANNSLGSVFFRLSN